MAGEKLRDLPTIDRRIDYFAVKEAVFPFSRFPGIDPVLSPEMKSTGEVMGISPDFGVAFAKSQLGAGTVLPEGRGGVRQREGRRQAADPPRRARAVRQGLHDRRDRRDRRLPGAGGARGRAGQQGGAGAGRTSSTRIKDGEIALIFNTTEGWQSLKDSQPIRASAVAGRVPYFTTASASVEAAKAIAAGSIGNLEVRPLQSYLFATAQLIPDIPVCVRSGLQGAARGWGLNKGLAMATVEKMPMLQEGYETLTQDLRRLKAERPLVVDAIEEARAHGDLSENAEYHAAKERQGQIEASISDIEDKLSRAQIIDPRDLSGDKIVFGATVTLLDDDDKPVRYQIVGQTEADAKTGRIS